MLAVGQCQKLNLHIQNPMGGRKCRNERKLVTLVVVLWKGQVTVVVEL